MNFGFNFGLFGQSGNGGIGKPPNAEDLLIWLKGNGTETQRTDSWKKPDAENFTLSKGSCITVNGVDDECVFSFTLPPDATITYQGTATAVLDIPGNKITFSTAGTFYDLKVYTDS